VEAQLPAHLVDCHTHAFPEKVAEKAQGSLARDYGREPYYDATVGGLVQIMDRAGVDVSVILPVAMRADQVRSINDWAARTASERVIVFGSLHPDYEAIEEEVERMLSMGIRGIKLQPGWQGFAPDEERMDRIYRACEGRLIICFHCGGELRQDIPLLSTPETLARVRERFPGLTMIAAHMGGFLMWDRAEELLIGGDLYLDISFCGPEYMPGEELARLIRKHGADRVLFGSDGPAGSVLAQKEHLLSLPLEPEELELVAWKNAARLLGLDSLS
jgi:predicted TIM-barrel fold metal-dependent hydrolase